MREEIESLTPNVCFRRLIFKDHVCQGRITWEHPWTYGGPQINEVWAIIKICAWAHDVDEFQDGSNLDKEKNQYISLKLARAFDLLKYPRTDWEQKKKYLFAKYDAIADHRAITQLRNCLCRQ